MKHTVSSDDDEQPASEEETREELLARSQRNTAPIANPFIQAPRGSVSRVGPLATFVKERDLRGLQAFLLLHAINSSHDFDGTWSSSYPLQVWARAFDTTKTATGQSARSAASRIITRLCDRKLITRSRTGSQRKVKLTLLNPDGSGRPYERPTGKTPADRFIKLPFNYWRDGWREKLDLPGTVMLLVCLHEKAGFSLPTEKVQDWYGWSADTAERGFGRLRELGLLHVTTRQRKAPLAPNGIARVNEYTLSLSRGER